MKSHVRCSLDGGIDNGRVLKLFSLHQSVIGQLVRLVIVINISIGGGNVPGSNHIAKVLEGALDFLIVGVTIAKGSVAVRGAHVTRHNSKHIHKGLFKSGHLGGNTIHSESGQLGMRPGVRRNLMARIEGTLEDRLDGGVVDTALVVSVDKEGHLQVLLVQKIQQLVCVLTV